MSKKVIRLLSSLFFYLSYFYINSSMASVVIDGTRIVLGGVNNQVVHFKNVGNTPYIVQVDGMDYNRSENQSKASPPLVATPNVFKMGAEGSQLVRLILIKKDLPQDKESIFNMSFRQIPGDNKADEGKNKIKLILVSKVKVIYRPEKVAAFSHDSEGELFYEYSKGKLIVTNNSPNVISINTIRDKGQKITDDMTILPYNKYTVTLKNNTHASTLSAYILDDYGVAVAYKIKAKQQQ